jgi:DNA-binding MarR family transcriptional regulator
VPALTPLFMDIVQLEIELWAAVEARLRDELGVGLATYQVLGVIDRIEDCRVGDVVRELAITVGGASKMVDRIEAGGYAARRPHPLDRRSSVIAPTLKGARLLDAAGALVEDELQARIGATLSDRSFDQLARAVTKLRAANAAAG